jgi:hypothetical protein
MRRVLLSTLAVLAITLLAIGSVADSPVEAARGSGKGGCKGKNCGSQTTAVLTVAPNPVPLGSVGVTIIGSGFAANQDLIINTSMFPQPRITTDGSGSFSFVYNPEGGFEYAGPASMQAIRASDGTVLATASYTVN